MLEELGKRAQQAVELAQRAGAQDAWASASRGRSVEYSWRDGALEKVQENTSRGLSISLYVDDRYSSHSTTDLRPEALERFIGEAVALTRALQPDPFRKIPDPSLFEGRPTDDLRLVDESIDGITVEQRLAWLKELDAGLHSDARVISGTSGVQDAHSMGASASSNGFFGTSESTSVWYGGEVTIQDEGDARPEGWMWAGARGTAGLISPQEIAATALSDALKRLGTQKGPSRKGLMIVDPRAAQNLVSKLLAPASGSSVQQSRSFWVDRLGKPAVSEKLVITDEPLLPGGWASRHFDGEGISAKPMDVIRGGALQNYYLSTYYARKLELAPTTGGASNRVVHPGSRDLAAILADAGDAIYVTSWLGGNSDATTGDFSLGMRGHLVHNGEIGGPIGEMNVTGNLLTLFSQLVEVGSDPWPYASLLVPTLVFDGVEFSGA
ncbi:MAG: TldD/PmbA family protein [Deltaproteobacteria bacterium]|nr:TldD/PmbA family protein [Deltaproteobacteria bacterium]